MFRTILIALAAAVALTIPVGAFAESPFITDTLAGNGTPHSSPWDTSNATWSVITDTLGGRGTPNSSPWTAAPAIAAPVSGLITDTLAGNGASNSAPFDVRISKPVSVGFNWGDAGVGAGAASGLLVLLAAAGALVRRNARPAY
jgi:hypothetical protein